MRNIWKYILIFIGLSLLIFIIYKLNEDDKKINYFKKIEFNQNNKIFNRTSQNYLDTIIYVGLEKLGVVNSTVLIYPLTNDMKKTFPEEYELRAFIKGVGTTYIIWIDDMSRLESIQVLSHELIHLEQYYHKKLTYSDDPYIVIWQKTAIDIRNISYEKHPWEIEAFEREIGMEKKILRELFLESN